MSDILNVTSTRLQAKGKQGILKPNADGYYTMPIGGLEVCNAVGIYYTSGAGVRELFMDKEGMLQRLLSNGVLKGENGHPKQRPGEDDEAYAARAIYPAENNVCVFFRRIWLDLEFGRNRPEYGNPNLIAIMGEFKPDGEKGHILQAAMDDPDQNVCFSIRSLSADVRLNGKKVRAIREVITFDLVTLPGIAFATKWDAPTLEDGSTGLMRREWLEKLVSANESDALHVANENAVLHAQSVLSRWPTTSKTLGFSGW